MKQAGFAFFAIFVYESQKSSELQSLVVCLSILALEIVDELFFGKKPDQS